MAWWTPFLVNTGLNLLSGQGVGQSLTNAGVNTATGNFINQIAPNFGVSMGDGLLSQETVNLGQPQGMASTGSFNPALRTGFQAVEPTRGMAETLARQTQNVTPDVTQNLGQPMTPAYRNINPALVADASKIPAEQMYVDTLASKYRPPFESPQLGQSVDYTGGGESPSFMGRLGDYAKEGIEFAKENPLLAGAGALALYRGINPPERPVAPPQAPGISRGGAVALGQPLQVRRPR